MIHILNFVETIIIIHIADCQTPPQRVDEGEIGLMNKLLVYTANPYVLSCLVMIFSFEQNCNWMTLIMKVLQIKL